MKYITTEDDKGDKEMFLFPESVNHAVMAEAVARLKDQMHGEWKRITRKPISAGFVYDGCCCGRSESLNLGPAEGDSNLLQEILIRKRI